MQIIEKKVTKLYMILAERGMSQKELYELIIKENDGNKVSMYILNEMINGKRTNYHINTAILISNALDVPIDDIVD
jgi:transcriptional regulator with XRE-family HTH domain